MAAKNPKDDPVHFPKDRRFSVRMRRSAFVILLTLIMAPLIVAWLQYAVFGLPPISAVSLQSLRTGQKALDFPLWLRIAHYVNLLFLVLLVRSGLSVLMDHPRLYWNDHCTPGTEWIRFTPLEVPTHRVWTAKDDARYISPLFALPGYRHTIGMARHWHFLFALIWVLNGLVYVTLLFVMNQWQRLAPTSWEIIPSAWSTFVYYATLHLPPEIHSIYGYNALQQLSYFVVVFMFVPLSFLTGMAMSPSIISRFPWYARLFGGRQSARSIHFLLVFVYIGFAIMHITMVVATGFVANMNHIVRGVDGNNMRGVVLGLIGLGAVAAVCYMFHWVAWRYPRLVQRLALLIHTGIMKRLLFRYLSPQARFSPKDISPRLWPNGNLPESEEWKTFAADDFRNYRLKIYGLVENPMELSLDELKALGKEEQITLHHCVQGWSGIAEWGGLSLAELVRKVRPKPEAKVVVFYSFGEGLYGGVYYDTQRLENVLLPQCILAYEMNYKPLGQLYGAPLRLRVENQLGYKMVKWIKAIEFVSSERQIGKGYGGKNEDDEYFDVVPEI